MTGKASGKGLVAAAAAKLRQMILALAPGSPMGSLPDIASALGVGVMTIRQAARLLEHEGFLKVRRGNGGGFFAARPNADSVGRTVAGFLDIARSQEREAIEIMTLLDCELMAIAAQASDEGLRDQLRQLAQRIDSCDTPELRAAFVQEMHNIVFKMVNRPLMEMMSRMSMQHYSTRSGYQIYEGREGTEQWKQHRHAIVAAILRRDAGLARFEAQRRRDYVLQSINSA